ncbi:bifunctional diguanylate cyclase/phosphodiesterase [Noviherbaspirillum autotrophicum]|uniref:bifunctional diguanylate cyclase/phosphodiesterase n=1 Tax=Noviherbaspirillum autotrophicum TaxID=709839 RepID=UPI0012FDA4EE|nr:EAL domain-containing protein [Noviherbaspirillum autotrophicum]
MSDVISRSKLNQTPPASRQRPVRMFLLWLVLGCLLPGVIGAIALLFDEYHQSRIQLERDTLQTARALIYAVDVQILGLQRLGQGLATADSIVSGNLARFHLQARRALAEARLGSTVALTDRTGQLVLNTAVEFGKPLPMNGNPELVRRVFEMRTPVASQLFASAITHHPLMAVGLPVLLDGKVIFALTVSIEPEQFDSIFSAQHLPAGWVATIFDGNGAIVARSNSTGKIDGKKPRAGYFQQLMKTSAGNFEASMEDGTPVSVAYAQSPTTGWRVAVNIPKASITTGLFQRLSVLMLGIAALFAMGIWLARVLSRRIARAFQALVTPAFALGSGETVSLPQVEVMEAAEVTNALAAAAKLLKERTVALEAREKDLVERSGALRRSENRLRTLTEHAPAAIAVFDRHMRYLAVSQRWIQDYRLEGKDIIGASHYDVVPDLPERWHDAHRRGLEGEALRADADRIEYSDGSVRWRRWEVWPWQDNNGAVGGIIIAAEDVTDRMVAERQLRESEARLALALKAANTAVWEMDVTTQALLPADDRLFTMLGYDQNHLQTLAQWLAHMHDEDRQSVSEMLNEVIDGRRDSYSTEVRFRAKDGHWHWILCQGTGAGRAPEGGRATRLVGTHTDIHARKLAEQRAREAALHDPLTGLPNRALVYEYGSHLLAAAQRNHGQGALMFIDLDRFKPINDIYGHEVGDRVLREVSARLVACTRQEDLVGRLGGDEFVIILPHLASDRRQAIIVARHIIDSISRTIVIDTLELSLSPSVGISYYPEHANDIGALIHTADLAMYQAKKSGRGNFHIYTPELNQHADEIYLLEARLKNALRYDGLELHYQPVMDIKSGTLLGAEALVRLAGNEPRVVGPQVFIPVAESAGLIGQLGEWVATEACRQQEAWKRDGLRVTIAINVSPFQFRQRGFAETLHGIILNTGSDPDCIQLEITESAIMENLDEAVSILNRIKALGVKVALDDFGTGYSSLSQLISLPIDKLKVDQSFVKRIGSDQASQAVTEAIIALGHSLKLEVIGEGIESEDTLRYLKERGCDQAQGYWFSPPLPASKFAEWYGLLPNLPIHR